MELERRSRDLQEFVHLSRLIQFIVTQNSQWNGLVTTKRSNCETSRSYIRVPVSMARPEPKVT